jgi:hypothetical protein
VNEEDMLVLAKAAIPECKMPLNLGAILLFYLDRQAIQTHGSIVCGGVGTVLANALNVTLGNLGPYAGDHLLGFCTLRSCHMVSRVNGQHVVHIPRAEHTYPADDTKQCATSLGLQVRSVVARVNFPHEETWGLYQTLGEQSKKLSSFSSSNLQNNFLVLGPQLHRGVVKHKV